VTGKVRLVAPTLNSNTSRGIVYVELPVKSPAQAGMYGSGTIETGYRDVLTLPDTAVVLRDGKSYVLVIQAGNRVKQQTVLTGQRRDGRIEIQGIARTLRWWKPAAPFLRTVSQSVSSGAANEYFRSVNPAPRTGGAVVYYAHGLRHHRLSAAAGAEFSRYGSADGHHQCLVGRRSTGAVGDGDPSAASPLDRAKSPFFHYLHL